MNPINYVRRFLEDAMKNFSALVVGPIWGWASAFWMSDSFWMSPCIWVSLLWTGTWIIGSILAVFSREENWDPYKSFLAVLRLVVALLCLGAADMVEHSGFTGSWIPAGIIDIGIIFTEITYFSKNVIRLANKIRGKKPARLSVKRPERCVGTEDHCPALNLWDKTIAQSKDEKAKRKELTLEQTINLRKDT